MGAQLHDCDNDGMLCLSGFGGVQAVVTFTGTVLNLFSLLLLLLSLLGSQFSCFLLLPMSSHTNWTTSKPAAHL